MHLTKCFAKIAFKAWLCYVVWLCDAVFYTNAKARHIKTFNFVFSFFQQEWTTATHIRLHFMKVKTLLGDLMPLSLQDPTVTRRVRIPQYFIDTDKTTLYLYICIEMYEKLHHKFILGVHLTLNIRN